VTRATLIAFAVLSVLLGLQGCGGNVEESNPGSTAGTAAPATPTGLTAAAMSSSQINLSWNAATASDGVAGYNVYRGLTQIAALGVVTTFQNTGLAPSTDYAYRIEAVNRNGKASPRSSEARARTMPAADTTAPSTPAGLTATVASSTQINLSWSAATDNVGVVGYNIYRGGTLIATRTVTNFQNTGLSAFTTYSYTVQAYDAAGNVSTLSASASATTQPVPDTTAPSTPAGLTATAVSASQINLSWGAATDNVGVTGYNVYRGGALIATLGTITTFQNTGLSASTTYSYAVRALDAAGNLSAPSASASATTQGVATDTTAPSTPAGLTATAVSASQINLSWGAATDNVGVTGYNVYRGGTLIANLGAVTAFQNNGLSGATTYTYTVQARDAAGNLSAPSASSSATTQPVPDTTAPSVPGGLSATAVSSSQINLSWTAATDNVGVTGYNVYRGGTLIASLGVATAFQSNGLTGATTYTYTVRARDAAGNLSAPSTAASATTLPVPDTTAPATPMGLSATAVFSTQINLSWTAATDNVRVTGYNVYRGGMLIATLGAVTSFQNTGLTGSTTYSYAVEAFDAAGNVSGRSTVVSATTPAPSTTARLTWTAPASQSIVGYRVYYGNSPGTYLQPRGQGINVGNFTTHTVTGLTSGRRYYFVATAYDAANNESVYSNEAFKDLP
jgi:chitodextrinase